MFEKIVKELANLNPNLNFNLVNTPMGEVHLDIRGGASVPLKAILKLPPNWDFKQGGDQFITNGRVDLHLVPLP